MSNLAGDTVTKTVATETLIATQIAADHPVQEILFLMQALSCAKIPIRNGLFSTILSMSVCATSKHRYFCLEVHAFNMLHGQTHQPVFSHVRSYILLAR